MKDERLTQEILEEAMTIPVVGTTSELRGDGVTMTALVGPGNGYDGTCI